MLLISQLHIQVRENGKYCRDGAIKLMEDLMQGPQCSSSSGRGRPTTILRKRKLEDLSERKKKGSDV